MNPQKTLTPADRFVIAVAVLLIVSLYGFFWRPSVAGTVIEYTTPFGHGSFPLDEDRKLTLRGSKGISHVWIHDGAVRFTDSPCQNKHCIHSGWLHDSGDFAACLPNQISLQVRGGDEQRFDAINY